LSASTKVCRGRSPIKSGRRSASLPDGARIAAS
jgi:hypothetical protein